MNLVVDTNIVFSTLLNPHSAIGDLLMDVQDQFVFYAPDLLKDELKKYSSKISAYSKLDRITLERIQELIISKIHFVSEDLISRKSWLKALELTKNVDENDTPFVALAVELNAKLWTGDKALEKGLIKNGIDITLSTAELNKRLR